MILNFDNIDVFQKKTWTPFAEELDKMGYNIKINSGRKGATVIEKKSGNSVGEVTRDMIDDEEMDYILYSRLKLTLLTQE